MTTAHRHLGPLLAVVAATVVLGLQSSFNAHQMAPCWGQDLAFFHQIVHSAATGGPWSTPLLLEPRGMLSMVHTHLVLPAVVAVYAVVPHQAVLLVAQAFFASLALWPAWRLGEAVAPRGGGWLAALGLALYGPFQGLAVADFRPSALFVPGVLGVWAVAWRGGPKLALVGWCGVAMLGREEAPYLLGTVAAALLVAPWGPVGRRLSWHTWTRAVRWRAGLAVGLTAALGLAVFIAVKPAMFYHFDPLHRPAPAALSPDHLADRLAFLGRLGRSGAAAGLLAPTALLPLVPLGREMLETGREWGPVVGPAAHYAAFWLPFAAAAWIVGAGRWLGRPGLALVLLLNAAALPGPGWRTGPVHLREVATTVSSEERVAADYDTIHLFAGREVLWNTAQLRMADNERPRGWVGDWPVPPSAVDVIIIRDNDPLLERLEDWDTEATVGDHLVLRRPDSVPPSPSPPGVLPRALPKAQQEAPRHRRPGRPGPARQ